MSQQAEVRSWQNERVMPCCTLLLIPGQAWKRSLDVYKSGGDEGRNLWAWMTPLVGIKYSTRRVPPAVTVTCQHASEGDHLSLTVATKCLSWDKRYVETIWEYPCFEKGDHIQIHWIFVINKKGFKNSKCQNWLNKKKSILFSFDELNVG